MKLIQNKSGQWVVYDGNGKIVIITTDKSTAINYAKKISSESES